MVHSMSATDLPAVDDLRHLANELEHNERLHAIDGRDSFPVDWVSKFHIRPFPIYVDALRIAARAADRKALAKVCSDAFATNEERTAAIQRYLLDDLIRGDDCSDGCERQNLMEAAMPALKQWAEMSLDEKLEALRCEIDGYPRSTATVTKALEDIRRRLDEIERRFEELPLS
jgi:hypothetical protein